MKRFFVLIIVVLLLPCLALAESPVIPADDDDILIMLEESIAQLECDYSCVTLNRKQGIFVIDIAFDGLTESILAHKAEGYNENFEQWVQFKEGMLFAHASTLEMFKTVHREDLKLIINIVNDDAYIREDYSTISFNPLLSVGVFGTVGFDAMTY